MDTIRITSLVEEDDLATRSVSISQRVMKPTNLSGRLDKSNFGALSTENPVGGGGGPPHRGGLSQRGTRGGVSVDIEEQLEKHHKCPPSRENRRQLDRFSSS